MVHRVWSTRIVAVVAVALAASGLAIGAGPSPSLADANESPGAPSTYRSLAAGTSHTCAILGTGQVKCWGNNGGGRLGLGDTDNRGDAAGEMGDDLPTVDLGTGRTATAITAGNAHTCALLDNATVKCWGNNAAGRLGLGDTNARGDAGGEMGNALPTVALGAGRTATAITAGNTHTCALLDNGNVKCWGNNASGQLGLGDTNARGDAAGEMGNSLPAVSLSRLATAITAGNGFTCALLDNGTVQCWGNSNSGQLGQGDVTQRGDGAGEMGNNLPAVQLGTGRTVTALTTGDTHTCAVLDNGTVKCWGSNGSGRLGLGDTANRGDGAGEMGDSLPVVDLGSGRLATGLSAGEAHTCAVLDNATVKCWGINSSGQLGQGNTTTRGDGAGEMGNSLAVTNLGTGRTATAVSAAGTHSCARLDNAAVKCWGENQSGELGLGDTGDRGDIGGEMGDSLAAVALGARRTPVSISAGHSHTCAVLDNGTVKCWGENSFGQLGLGDVAPRGDGGGEMGDALAAVPLGSGRTAVAVSAGDRHTCAVLDNGTVKCWGSNANGRLGLGDTTTRGDGPGEMGDALPSVDLGTGRTAHAIATGGEHTCALLDDGTVKCWGDNPEGQLGLGDTNDRGDGPGEMGDALPVVSLGTGRTATLLAAGASGDHMCALLDDATVKCWGSNLSGKLGLGDVANRGDAPGEMGNALPGVDLGTGRTAVHVDASAHHTCALLDNATVKCWGFNGNGELGQGDQQARGDDANEMGDNLLAVSLGTGRTATGVDVGQFNSCTTLDNATLKCWGSNNSGQLGVGNTTNRGGVSNSMGDNLLVANLGTGRSATSVSAGQFHVCALLDNGTVKCWGDGFTGKLGLGDTDDRGDQAGEMGDALPVVELGSETPLGVTGQVTDGESGDPVPGAFVALLRTTDFAIAGGAVANTGGTYAVEAPPGSYFVFAIDPAGRHAAGFAGAPTVVNVAAPGLVDTDAALAPLRGAVQGTIRESPSATPIPGAWALALTAGGAPEVAAQANGSGAYRLDDLTAGSHYIGWVDPNGDHAPRFSVNSPNVPDATPVTVTAGDSVTRNGSLPIQASTPGGAALTGTVTQTGTNAPLPGILVIAQHAADFRLARAETTDNSGNYSLDVAAGSYKLVFLDPTGRHAMEWHNNQPFFEIGNAANVTAPAVTNATLDVATGTMAGTLTDAATGDPLPGAWAFAIGPTGTVTGTVTNPDGTYSITGLAPGTYRATFVDPVGGGAQEYFDNSPDYFGGTNINITAGTTTPSINAALTQP